MFIGPQACVVGGGEGERGLKATMFINPHVCVVGEGAIKAQCQFAPCRAP